MKYPKLRELKFAIQALFKGPYTTEYPHKQHIPFPGFRGRPTPDKDKCIGCGACSEVCPSSAIEVKEDITKTPPTRKIIWHYDRCNFCGQCERLCTTREGVKLTQEFDLATTDRNILTDGVEKELILCSHCGTPIATRQHLLWLRQKLGPLATGNYALNLLTAESLGLTSPDEYRSGITELIVRQNIFQILCPKCRHRSWIFNQTGKGMISSIDDILSLIALAGPKSCLVGLGNTDRADDAWGVELVRQLKKHKYAFPLIEAGETLENYFGKILALQPQVLVIADAIFSNQAPGKISVFLPQDLADYFSPGTHNTSLFDFLSTVEKDFSSRIYIIGIEPKTVEFNQEMSEPIKNGLDYLVKRFITFELCTS